MPSRHIHTGFLDGSNCFALILPLASLPILTYDTVSPHAGGEPAFKANSLIFVIFQEENLSHVMHYHFSR